MPRLTCQQVSSPPGDIRIRDAGSGWDSEDAAVLVRAGDSSGGPGSDWMAGMAALGPAVERVGDGVVFHLGAGLARTLASLTRLPPEALLLAMGDEVFGRPEPDAVRFLVGAMAWCLAVPSSGADSWDLSAEARRHLGEILLETSVPFRGVPPVDRLREALREAAVEGMGEVRD